MPFPHWSGYDNKFEIDVCPGIVEVLGTSRFWGFLWEGR
jgi:hypothetical protein